ncbi:MAG: hypothetical protein B0W54_04080 [Cellvibrio sp. 79]|nr:MAG: hypothetical protein B0W54_04080 [Cellvibrio sp. 79]
MVSDEEKKMAEDSRFRELSPGKLLVWGRERAALTQEQVAKELYMTLTKVRALELDDYRHMGSDTFTRGYLRSYANLIKLDVGQVLASYDRHAYAHGLVEQVLPRKVESASKPLWQFAVIIVGVLLVLWLISVWFFDNRKEPSYNIPAAIVSPSESYVTTSLIASSITSIESSSVTLSSAAIISPLENSVVGSHAVSSVANTSANNPANVLIKSSIKSEASSSSKTLVRGNALDQIVFSFSAECWLEVSDSRGDVLVADLQPTGGHLVLQGKAPFDVKLGNASAVQIELNDEKVAVVPALGTNVLSLKIGKSTSQ